MGIQSVFEEWFRAIFGEVFGIFVLWGLEATFTFILVIYLLSELIVVAWRIRRGESIGSALAKWGTYRKTKNIEDGLTKDDSNKDIATDSKAREPNVESARRAQDSMAPEPGAVAASSTSTKSQTSITTPQLAPASISSPIATATPAATAPVTPESVTATVSIPASETAVAPSELLATARESPPAILVPLGVPPIAVPKANASTPEAPVASIVSEDIVSGMYAMKAGMLAVLREQATVETSLGHAGGAQALEILVADLTAREVQHIWGEAKNFTVVLNFVPSSEILTHTALMKLGCLHVISQHVDGIRRARNMQALATLERVQVALTEMHIDVICERGKQEVKS